MKDQLDTIKVIKNLYMSREEIIKLYNDCANIKSEATRKAKSGAGLKILTYDSNITNSSCTC